MPLEPIELDAFRSIHEHDSFWCGLLLGGCGGQLTTKLYTDRVCHFAHHPGSDGQPHICGRQARSVNSADHLYVKSAATAWASSRGTRAAIDFAQPDGSPMGSVVDIRLVHNKLRVHLDRSVAPQWDGEHEPVLGVSVPVDPDTLIKRWYVNRIRLDSEGTSRRVRIGTEAFARPTEWFSLDECEMTERGLSTPAVERIVQSRSTPPPSIRVTRRDRKQPDARTRAHVLFRRIEEARLVGAVVVVTRVSRTLEALEGADQETQAQIYTVLEDATVWLQKQAVARQEMFSRLSDAAAGGDVQETRGLLAHVNAIAAHDRTDTETQTAAAAAAFLAGALREQEETARRLNAAAEAKEEARRRTAWEKANAVSRVRTTLRTLRRNGRTMLGTEKRRKVAMLTDLADKVGDQLTRNEINQIKAWKARVQRERKPAAELPLRRNLAPERAPKSDRNRNTDTGQ
ncbi:zinc finger domain-containing protein [Streptomyces sp. NPDC055886]